VPAVCQNFRRASRARFKRAYIVAAHPARRWRVVTRAILCRAGIRLAAPRTPSQDGTEGHATNPNRDSVQKIAAGNGAVHPQFVIARILHRSQLFLLLDAFIARCWRG